MKLWAAALAMTAFMVGPARADERAPDIPHGGKICNEANTHCIVNRADLEDLIAELRVQFTTSQIMQQAAARQVDDIVYLRAELVKLREIKGCAKLEVLPKGGRN